jgi:hypothetical protein
LNTSILCESFKCFEYLLKKNQEKVHQFVLRNVNVNSNFVYLPELLAYAMIYGLEDQKIFELISIFEKLGFKDLFMKQINESNRISDW